MTDTREAPIDLDFDRLTSPSMEMIMLADPPHEPQGWEREQGWFKRMLGFGKVAVQGAPSTTRQTEILNLALTAAPTSTEGILIGQDGLTWTMVAHDPVTAYLLGIVDSPNVAVLGAVGSGKSSLIKCVYLLRPLLLKNTRFVVVDYKPGSVDVNPNGEQVLYGEYQPVAKTAGVTPIRFSLDGFGSRINLLDPALLAAGTSGGSLAILSNACQLLNDGTPLSAIERKMLRQALAHVVETRREKAQLMDLIAELEYSIPTEKLRANVADEYALAAATVGALLERLIVEFPGLFDGPTSEDVKLDEKLTVFDINGLPEDGPLISIVMMVINVWVLGTIRRSRVAGEKIVTYFIVDEGWFLVGGPMGKIIRSNAKLSRGLGLCLVVGLHHVNDIPSDDPAIAFIKEAGTLHLYRQERRDDAEAVERITGLQPGAAETLMTLEKGHHYLKRGQKAEIHVRHLRSKLEETLTNTDTGLVGDEKRRTAT